MGWGAVEKCKTCGLRWEQSINWNKSSDSSNEKGDKKMKQGNKTQEVQAKCSMLWVMPSTFPVLSVAPGESARIFIPGMTSHGKQYPFGPFRSAVPAVLLQGPRNRSQWSFWQGLSLFMHSWVSHTRKNTDEIFSRGQNNKIGFTDSFRKSENFGKLFGEAFNQHRTLLKALT